MSKNLIIPKDHWSNIQSLSKELAGELLQACISEALGQEYDLTSQKVVSVFEPIRRTIRHRRHKEEVENSFLDAVAQEELKIKIKKNTHLRVAHRL